MGYAIAVAVSFAAGVVVCWIYRAKVEAELQKELAALKASAISAANKL